MSSITLRVRSMAGRWRGNRIALIGFITAVSLVCLSAFNPTILAVGNLTNILVQTAYLAIFAAAQTVIIIGRGLDLSLGATVSVVSVCTAMLLTQSDGGVFMVLICVAAGITLGALIGAINGVGVAVGKVDPFIMTLATLSVLTSIATTISGGFPVQALPSAFLWIASFQLAGAPLAIFVAAVLLVGLDWMLRRTSFGHSLYFIGSNADAARAAGIPVKMYRGASYVIGSAIVGFGAILLTARTGSGEPNLGGDLTLGAIAAAVLGGVNLNGGTGSILSPIAGALLVTVFTNGMNLLGVNGFIQQIFIGAIILGALALDRERT